jgi:hypothetical protein
MYYMPRVLHLTTPTNVQIAELNACAHEPDSAEMKVQRCFLFSQPDWQRLQSSHPSTHSNCIKLIFGWHQRNSVYMLTFHILYNPKLKEDESSLKLRAKRRENLPPSELEIPHAPRNKHDRQDTHHLSQSCILGSNGDLDKRTCR